MKATIRYKELKQLTVFNPSDTKEQKKIIAYVNKKFNCESDGFTETGLCVKIKDSTLEKQVYDGKEFFISKDKVYGVFNHKDMKIVLLQNRRL